MNSQFLGLNNVQFNTLVLILLLVILGIVTFHYYAYVSSANGLSFGTGFGVNIMGNRNRRN